ncbi:hypothetical protein D2E25_0571 [Bifidobacterium goeldii]|uniref:Cell division protein FtsL n=1 Tax=Bifidobacterium goeldii TaxID=2306975 RepID=A0A430FN47_9BIFI|nr:hypothetical protein [Bifidobacterium goeldii]RSX54263.1 hypothetical protein D2E25_0571 [Bifidobacterium goeldii]
MASTSRTVRSSAAPAGRRAPSEARPASRPQLHIVDGTRSDKSPDGMAERFRRLIAWTRTRSTPLIHIVIAVAFLLSTLLGALMLRTQMVQNSFEASEVQNHINVLSQDVQDDRAKLDALIASLPDKAQKMGMVPSQDSITIDLNGYTPSKGSAQ